MTYTFTKWTWGPDVREDEFRAQLHADGLRPYVWSNGPNFEYSAHTHSYTKVIYVVSGSITFLLPDSEEDIDMQAGDRLVLPARVLHAATVGTEGVVCLEAAKRD